MAAQAWEVGPSQGVIIIGLGTVWILDGLAAIHSAVARVRGAVDLVIGGWS